MDNLVHWCYDLGTHVSRRFIATGPTFRLTELPPDVVASVLGFLTGYDLLPLSHVNRQFFFGVLASDSEIWQRLAPLGPPSDCLLTRGPQSPSQQPPPRYSAHATEARATHASSDLSKRRYFSRRSIRFHGARVSDRSDRGGAIVTPSPQEISLAGSFSFDLVFALLPTLDANLTGSGGILLGAQSVGVTRDRYAINHSSFVYTDPEGNLYCSMMRNQPMVAEKLTFQRWYHVALVFEVTAPGPATQRVYLDGELIHAADGWLHHEWAALTSMQLGTGCLTGGWYAFNGLVDECRFWNGALHAAEVRGLVGGGHVATTASGVACTWSMRAAAAQSALGHVSIVRSTSPAERLVSEVDITGVLSRTRIPTWDSNIQYCFG